MLATSVTTWCAAAFPFRVRALAAAVGGVMVVTLLSTEASAAQCSTSGGAVALGKTAGQSRTVWLTKTRDGFRVTLSPNGAKGIAVREGKGGKQPCVVDPQKEEPPAAALAEEGRGGGVKGGGKQDEGGDGGDSGHHQGGGNSGQGVGNQGDGDQGGGKGGGNQAGGNQGGGNQGGGNQGGGSQGGGSAQSG